MDFPKRGRGLNLDLGICCSSSRGTFDYIDAEDLILEPAYSARFQILIGAMLQIIFNNGKASISAWMSMEGASC